MVSIMLFIYSLTLLVWTIAASYLIHIMNDMHLSIKDFELNKYFNDIRANFIIMEKR